jgi:hypothetical protein
VDALISLVDDTIIVVSGQHALDVVRGLVFLPALVINFVVYVLMALTPMVPKRVFLPVALFNLLGILVVVPICIYDFRHFERVAWAISAAQVALGLAALRWAQGGWSLRWPVVPEDKVPERPFSWTNLVCFVAANVFVLLPGVVAYLVLCSSLAVDHFSGGFLALHRDGLAVCARTYAGPGGKTVQLVPMVHIGETNFYQQISESLPTNSLVLLEGVSDRKHLLDDKLSYKRLASSLGLTEQREVFGPGNAASRRADVDVDQFSKETLGFINTAIRFHSKGFTPDAFRELFEKSQSPELLNQLLDDLLTKRNEHLLSVMTNELARADCVVAPWGAAHMPGLARKIQSSGYHLVNSKEYYVFKFRHLGRKR